MDAFAKVNAVLRPWVIRESGPTGSSLLREEGRVKRYWSKRGAKRAIHDLNDWFAACNARDASAGGYAISWRPAFRKEVLRREQEN